MAAEEIIHRVPASLVFWIDGFVAADCDVNDDVCRVFHNFQALVDSAKRVYIPDSATIHQHVTLEMLRWEKARNGGAG